MHICARRGIRGPAVYTHAPCTPDVRAQLPAVQLLRAKAVELLLPARMAGTPLDDSRTARTVALEFRPSRLTRRWLQNAELTSPLALCFRIRSSYSRHRPEQPRVG